MLECQPDTFIGIFTTLKYVVLHNINNPDFQYYSYCQCYISCLHYKTLDCGIKYDADLYHEIHPAHVTYKLTN